MERRYHLLPHELAKFKHETFIDPLNHEWKISSLRRPFTEDKNGQMQYYRECWRIDEKGVRHEDKLLESTIDALRKAREIYLKNQQNPRGDRR